MRAVVQDEEKKLEICHGCNKMNYLKKWTTIRSAPWLCVNCAMDAFKKRDEQLAKEKEDVSTRQH